MKYAMKPYVVDAAQWTDVDVDDNGKFQNFVGNDYSYFNCPGDGSITIKIGGIERSIKPGEWLVRVAPGEYRVMADAVFIREYHPFDISVFEEQIEKIVARKLHRCLLNAEKYYTDSEYRQSVDKVMAEMEEEADE